MTKISAVIADELAAALEQRARTEDRSASAVVRRALAEHLKFPPRSVVVARGKGRSSLGATAGSTAQDGDWAP